MAAELKRLEDEQNAALADLLSKATASSADDSSTPSPPSNSSPTAAGVLASVLPSSSSPPPEPPAPRDRGEVARKLEGMARKLEERRGRGRGAGAEEDLRPVLEARSEVVRCLREHDRRPLDCWREKDRFLEEVRKLEDKWVQKVVS